MSLPSSGGAGIETRQFTIGTSVKQQTIVRNQKWILKICLPQKIIKSLHLNIGSLFSYPSIASSYGVFRKR